MLDLLTTIQGSEGASKALPEDLMLCGIFPNPTPCLAVWWRKEFLFGLTSSCDATLAGACRKNLIKAFLCNVA